MTRQEIFDKVAPALLKQGRKSITQPGDSGYPRCLYLNPDGLKCAIGFLIDDDDYSLVLEEGGAVDINPRLQELLARNGILGGGTEQFVDDLGFLRGLQECHDRYEPNCWRSALTNFAGRYELDASCIQ